MRPSSKPLTRPRTGLIARAPMGIARPSRSSAGSGSVSSEPQRLRELFGRTEFLRTVNRYGFVSVQRFYLYAEQGLARQRVSIWIYEGQLRIEYHKTLVARYRCLYDRRHGQLHDVNAPLFYTTPFASPQLELIELDDEQWRKFQRRPARNYSKRIAMFGHQLSLLDLGTSALILWALKAV